MPPARPYVALSGGERAGGGVSAVSEASRAGFALGLTCGAQATPTGAGGLEVAGATTRYVIKASSMRHHDDVQKPRALPFWKLARRPAKAPRKPAWSGFRGVPGAVVSVMKVVVVSCRFSRGKPSREPPAAPATTAWAVRTIAASSPCHQRQRNSVSMRLALVDPPSLLQVPRYSGGTDALSSAFLKPGAEGV